MAAAASLTSLRRHPDFRRVLLGQVFSALGTWVQTFATTWLVLSLTHSAAAVGVLALCQFLPFTLFGLFAGPVIERFDPHRVVLTTQSLLLVIAGTFAVLNLTGAIRIWMISALSVIAGLVMVLDSPGRQALTFALVGREDLSAATGMTT